jgi:predicted dienelactone hydrolase
VGMFGMSAGGHTALSLAGGRWSESTLNAHCQAHTAEDFNACAGPNFALSGGWFDSIRIAVAQSVIAKRLQDTQWHAHTDPRIRAIVAGVPFAADFDVASFAQTTAPLALIQAQRDIWLKPQFHSAAVLSHCPTCTLLLDLPSAGHSSLLSPLPSGLSGNLASLLADPPEFDRAAEVPRIHRRISDYFVQHLLP